MGGIDFCYPGFPGDPESILFGFEFVNCAFSNGEIFGDKLHFLIWGRENSEGSGRCVKIPEALHGGLDSGFIHFGWHIDTIRKVC